RAPRVIRSLPPPATSPPSSSTAPASPAISTCRPIFATCGPSTRPIGILPLSPDLHELLAVARGGHLPDDAEARRLVEADDLDALTETARAIRDAAFGDVVTFSK